MATRVCVLDGGGPTDSENTLNSFLTKCGENVFWQIGPDMLPRSCNFPLRNLLPNFSLTRCTWCKGDSQCLLLGTGTIITTETIFILQRSPCKMSIFSLTNWRVNWERLLFHVTSAMLFEWPNFLVFTSRKAAWVCVGSCSWLRRALLFLVTSSHKKCDF